MNLIEEAQSLLLQQLADSPKIKALVRCLVTPFQDVLDIVEKLHHGHYIDDAYGQRLDVLGHIVDQPRRDMSDEDYRAWIDVGIRLNQGSGTAEDILAILNILYRKHPDFLMHEYQPDDVVFILLSLPMAPLKAVFAIVRSALPLTICGHFIRADKAPIFRFEHEQLSFSYFADYFLEDVL